MSEFNTDPISIPIEEEKSSDIYNDTANSSPIPVKEGEFSEERIQWLRDRGVLIEFPEDLKREKKANDKANASPISVFLSPSTSSPTGLSSSTRTVSIVKIPSDDKLPCQELNVLIQKNVQGDQLLNVLKPLFQGKGEGLDTELINKSSLKQFGSEDITVNPDTLKSIGQQGSCEAFPIAYACDDNNHCCVSLYLDECGQLKHLESNKRAIQIAELCGFKSVPLVGDMYVGRTRKFPGQGIEHENFRLPDLDSDSVWLRGVEKSNYNVGVANGSVTMDSKDDTIRSGEDKIKGYKWSENSENVEITMNLIVNNIPITSKEINVKISSKSVVVKKKNANIDELPVLNISLYKSVCVDDSTWTLNKGILEITMEKSDQGVTWGNLEPK